MIRREAYYAIMRRRLFRKIREGDARKFWQNEMARLRRWYYQTQEDP